MIEIEQLTKRHGRVNAVDRLSFTVTPGRVTGFLGPNGAGKSTTIRLLLGLDTPTSGRALIAGRPYHAMCQPLRKVGALLDATAVHGGRTAYDHLLCIAQTNAIGPARVREVLELTGMASVARRRVRTFSLGMKQRLGVAAALLGDPEILIFDEPINGLDPEGIRWIRTLMTSLAAEGRTIFVSSHLMSEMARTADHLVIIGRGRLIADTAMTDFIRDSAPGSVLVRSPQAAALTDVLIEQGATVVTESTGALAVTGLDPAEISALAGVHALAIHELTRRTASLEEAYLSLADRAVQYRGSQPTVGDGSPTTATTRTGRNRS
jgi:ABC-2 type transport system ATP-binding protein